MKTKYGLQLFVDGKWQTYRAWSTKEEAKDWYEYNMNAFPLAKTVKGRIVKLSSPGHNIQLPLATEPNTITIDYNLENDYIDKECPVCKSITGTHWEGCRWKDEAIRMWTRGYAAHAAISEKDIACPNCGLFDDKHDATCKSFEDGWSL